MHRRLGLNSARLEPTTLHQLFLNFLMARGVRPNRFALVKIFLLLPRGSEEILREGSVVGGNPCVFSRRVMIFHLGGYILYLSYDVDGGLILFLVGTNR